MKNFDRKNHWENIYKTKELKEVSWYEPTPQTSLDFIRKHNVAKTAKVIDIGGGDGFLVDHLLDLGYQDISVLDLSETAINRAKERLGMRATKVKWIVSDAATFKPTERYDFWHDRAAFHFLTDENEILNYIKTASQNITPDGILVIGTFSESGPTKCSGIDIKQYSENSMTERLNEFFEKIECVPVDHRTPFGTTQNFMYCSFKKMKSVSVPK